MVDDHVLLCVCMQASNTEYKRMEYWDERFGRYSQTNKTATPHAEADVVLPMDTLVLLCFVALQRGALRVAARL
jgi:hypothetical protein